MSWDSEKKYRPQDQLRPLDQGTQPSEYLPRLVSVGLPVIEVENTYRKGPIVLEVGQTYWLTPEGLSVSVKQYNSEDQSAKDQKIMTPYFEVVLNRDHDFSRTETPIIPLGEAEITDYQAVTVSSTVEHDRVYEAEYRYTVAGGGFLFNTFHDTPTGKVRTQMEFQLA